MGKTEVQAAVTLLITQQRAAQAEGLGGMTTLLGAISTVTSTFAGVTENSISQATIDTMNTAITALTTGRIVVQSALDNWQHALENNNVGLRNE